MSVAELAYEQIKTLPESQAREVLVFIGYLKEKTERAEWQDLMAAQAASLAAVWDNSEDEVWNDL
ncbi:hypothetical protein CKO31_05885 [Thiohalocapsa halophila]|uniref:DUF2281 domain-containing protein n=1 Tax=Thiohalocapsa halophila TaxID=69359 RepID=A0ABS1CEF5_9GAMM|nr:hypothetical protein [Thiohalocapsa halophila]MBK1630284.1 hypothetical protein [Thiohalocapsa halophila]